jgi:hypothetical protein
MVYTWSPTEEQAVWIILAHAVRHSSRKGFTYVLGLRLCVQPVIDVGIVWGLGHLGGRRGASVLRQPLDQFT